MLEGLVAWVLNNYLGKYVENLNTDQLSIAILSGEVELENLPLRKDALRHLGIPIEIKAGHIGKVKLQIPIRQLRSAPWVILIERLYLVAGPLSLDDWDQGAEELADQERKLAALDAIEACWRLESDSSATNSAPSTYYASSYSSWLNYGTGIITDIVENMQLHIRDVHVRYEDATSAQGTSACACGLTVESLSAQSCAANWTPQFTTHRDGSSPLSFKTIELRNLAVYWDGIEECELVSKLQAAELAAAMDSTSERQHKYLIAPVSACAHLQRNRSELPLRSRDTPRVVCDLTLDQVPLSLVDWQYEQMVSCLRGLQFLSRVQQHRKRRPSTSVRVEPRVWWMYAVSCHVPDACRVRATWDECLTRARENVRYVDMYARMLAQPSAAPGTELKRLKDTVEWSRDFKELRALREVAMRRVPCAPSTTVPVTTTNTAATTTVNVNSSTHGRSVLVKWFPQWWGWYSAAAADKHQEATAAPTATVTTGEQRQQLEDEILVALADSAKNNTLLRRDVVFGKFNFVLNGGTLNLCASNGSMQEECVPMLELQFSELRASVESRPRLSSHSIELSLATLCLRDRLTTGTLFPVLVGPPGRDRISAVGRTARKQLLNLPRTPGSGLPADVDDGPLFKLVYEAGTGVRRLHVKSQPLDVVYQPAVARWLVEFVCAPHQRSAARHRLEAMKIRTKQELMEKWDNMLEGRAGAVRTAWDLRLDVSAPQVILVERFCDPGSAIAVIDLGTLRLENGSQPVQSTSTQFPASSSKSTQQQQQQQQTSTTTGGVPAGEEDDDDMFMTPCSTPPGSEASESADGTLVTALSELSLHRRLYDTYTVDLSDIQVLVGRVRDNWRYAHTKGSSALHVLDRFNISLQVERRVVPTTDPMYPSLTLSGNLPRLVAHVNEQKIASLRTLVRVITESTLPSPFANTSPHHQPPGSHFAADDADDVQEPVTSSSSSVTTPVAGDSVGDGGEPSKLLTVQFTVDQMSLEVQSRGRSVAELQVSGVTASMVRRPCDVCVSLTVHGLLLVDALQTFGPDFELLVASHRHVGMDSMSGSLRDSEPTSPTSPGSPDPSVGPRVRATSPVALSRALSGLAVSPPPPAAPLLATAGAGVTPLRTMATSWPDVEALISVEFMVVSGTEPLRLATIQFNNLDIIANQETIVELVGFVRRVTPSTRSRSTGLPARSADLQEPTSQQHSVHSPVAASVDAVDGAEEAPVSTTRTEVTFDFHRLSVLLLRGAVEEGRSIGRKISTATMCEARIQATVDGALSVHGSLGGLQVLDLTPEGYLHQRIISIGRDPLAEELPSLSTDRFRPNMYPQHMSTSDTATNFSESAASFDQFSADEATDTAFSFNIHRPLDELDSNPLSVTVRMASVWYTHSPQFITELRSCATEFKQYLADVARSIRSAATDVALGLVHARTEQLAQSLYGNARFSAADVASPRRIRRRSTSVSEPNTPYSLAGDEEDDNVSSFDGEVRVDIVFDSPVLVLPRSSTSEHVLVAHLGKITLNNTPDMDLTAAKQTTESSSVHLAPSTYSVEIRDMNICTLDTSGRRQHTSAPRAEQLYSCESPVQAVPVLHDTLVRLKITKYPAAPPGAVIQQPESVLLHHHPSAGGAVADDVEDTLGGSLVEVTGSVVNALRVSLTRAQYEQVLDTLKWLTGDETAQPRQDIPVQQKQSAAGALTEIAEEVVGGVSTLSMDPHVRAKLFPSVNRRHVVRSASLNTTATSDMRLSVRFDVGSFNVELHGELGTGLVGLSFGEFLFTCEKLRRYETDIQVSLRSLLVEDLLVAPADTRRRMIASREDTDAPPVHPYMSHSCPEDVAHPSFYRQTNLHHCGGSLPDHLDTRQVFGATFTTSTHGSRHRAGHTPRPTVRAQTRAGGLVLVTSVLVDPTAPEFATKYSSLRKSTTVDLGSVDMVVCASAWTPLLDFFNVSEEDPEVENTGDSCGEQHQQQQLQQQMSTEVEKVGNSALSVTVRSLSLLATRPDARDIARGRVTGAKVSVTRVGNRRRVEGRLGALQVYDATDSAHVCADRFVTIGDTALEFHYVKPPPRIATNDSDQCNIYAELVINISTCVYVHTKRFIAEVRAFFADFNKAEPSQQKKSAVKQENLNKVSLAIRASTPVVLLPVRARCRDVLVLDLGHLTIDNQFISRADNCQLDVMQLVLHDVDVYTAELQSTETVPVAQAPVRFGECAVLRKGNSLLPEKCRLEFRVDKNLTPRTHRDVPDMTISSCLSTLEVTLDLHQYALIRGMLAYNLGEDTESILASVTYDLMQDSVMDVNSPVWTLSSLRIDLLDVRVRLRALACINFVRSRLTLDSFSDLSQDVDLVSRQILITDERPQKNNVFTEVLRPAARWSTVAEDAVQAEVHSRRRRDKSKFTVLLNNMRVMMVPDWWQSAGDFVFTLHTGDDDLLQQQQQHQWRPHVERTQPVPGTADSAVFEFRLNITDSEIVLMEDVSKIDTNAVILRSTTLLTYIPSAPPTMDMKPLSCSVNHLELFSCVLGADHIEIEDTALSILDPVTLSLDVCSKDQQQQACRTLEIQLHELTVRVSYRDIVMFATMFDSITKQTRTSPKPMNHDVAKLVALGFTKEDCQCALRVCNGRLDDAALWLTQNAVPHVRNIEYNSTSYLMSIQPSPSVSATTTAAAAAVPLDIRTVEVKAACVRLCLIDDCGDVDVPLAEVTMSSLCAAYELTAAQHTPPAGAPAAADTHDMELLVMNSRMEDCAFAGSGTGGSVECTLTIDYYNRVLGGWEPFVEPWKCRGVWRPEDVPGGGAPRHRLAVYSDDVLDVNVTDALLALCRLVKEAWTREDVTGMPRTVSRSPFVPYSLKNDTGTVLYFATVVTEPDQPFRPMEPDDAQLDQDEHEETFMRDVTWTEVASGDTVPFSYAGRRRAKQRHKESHRLRAHQLAVRVRGWRHAAPVTVDRVGVYFRHAQAERGALPYNRPVRLVFDVRLDGSARKLVTVRSALVLINKLPDTVDVKLVERSPVNAVSTASRTATVTSGGSMAVPLVHAHSHIFVRPSDANDSFSYCQPDVPWSRTTRPGDRAASTLRCSTNRGTEYWLCCQVHRERYPPDTGTTVSSAGHTVVLRPGLLLVNLLPQDVHYSVCVPAGDDGEPAPAAVQGRVSPGQSVSVPAVDPEAGLDLQIHLENFRCAAGVSVPMAQVLEAVGEYTCRLRLEDLERRRLFLAARVECNRGARLRVTVTAPYWIVNRTGLPLVFRQEGVAADTAGQFEEHELARMVAPLLFSFADQDASPTVVARVGHKHSGGTVSTRSQSSTPHWCQQFHLRRGVQVRRLRVSHEGATPDTVYVVGIEVRPARGRRRHRRDTSIVTVSPRHQLHNKSTHSLEFAQACHATTISDPGARATHVHAPPGCHVPFHWPRLDRDQLLCVRCTTSSISGRPTCWSGGLRIDAPLSTHLILRDATTGCRTLFLHVEVLQHGATHYVVFGDADSLPPPMRVDNCAEVAVTFAQAGCPAHTCIAHAHRSVPYAWDEPTWPTRLVVTAPGGVTATYDVDRLGRGQQLTYENFIYVAFTGTFNTEDDLDQYNEDDYSTSSTTPPALARPKKKLSRTGPAPAVDPVRSQRLVLDVTEQGRVVLAGKQPGKRSQLWRMTSTGQLQHEGSSPPAAAGNASSASGAGILDEHIVVLDIEAPAPQPNSPRPSRLALRRPDPRRRTTQTWRFTGDGRLCCAHRNMCVQSQDGLLGLRPGSSAVLGVPDAGPTHRATTRAGVPLEQAVGKQRMRPGSGLLAVEITTDGPTRVLRVTDMKQKEPLAARALADHLDWTGVSPAHRPTWDKHMGSAVNNNISTSSNDSSSLASELQITVMLRAGLGISVIGGARELLYLQLNNIIGELVTSERSRELCVSVQDAQCDNQLADTPCPVLLHAARPRTADAARRNHALPVLELRAEVQPTAGTVVIFKHLIVCVRPVAVHLEETLILRMYEFFLTAATSGGAQNTSAPMDEDEEDATSRALADEDDAEVEMEESVTGAATSGAVAAAAATGNAATTTRYHFGIIRLVPGPIRLSVHTASSLPARLRTLKRRLGLTLVGFEDAPVELEPYVRHHPFETGARLSRSVVAHFRDELLWQAAAILGSVDFLGSPLGLLGDVSEGVSGLIRERSVGALVLNVAHGLSNSAAKVTETLGDGLGRVTMDDAHEEMRQRIRRKHARGSGGEHLVAGIKGLGFGLLGGATGIFKQVYEGAASDGLPGVFSGLGKGLVGAVAKPVVGVLDLATETARAVRDSSRGAGRTVPERRRQPRATLGPGGLLPPYSQKDSSGQAYLRSLATTSSKSVTSSTSAHGSGCSDGGAIGYELYVAYECVRSGADDLRVIVSNERVRVVTGGAGYTGSSNDTMTNMASAHVTLTTVTETGLGELVSCVPVTQDAKHYIEMTVRTGAGAGPGVTAIRRPRIRCDTEELARAVSRQVNYAKRLHEEAAHTLQPTDD